MAKLKILLVDDEPDFLELMGMRIKSWGYDFIEAKNGKEGLEAVKKQAPDIIVLDYMLPDMDGVATLEEIRKINKEIPVIMFTAYPETTAMQETERLGIEAFIPKLSIYSDTQTVLKLSLNMVEKKLGKIKE